MTLFQRDLENQEIGIEKGRKEGREKGREEGREEGRAEGEHNALLATARRMKSKGYSVDIIADVTKLPPSEIESL